MAALLNRWQAEYRKTHPAVQFENKLMGSASAMAGIYTGVAELAWMGHELRTEESMAFEWVFQYKALGIEVATASVDQYDHGAQLVIFVHRDNPITRLNLAQLDAIFGSEHRRGSPNIRTWGELGLNGEWAAHQIHPYGYDAETEAGSFFRGTVLSGSYKWNCDLTAFRDEQLADGKTVDAAPHILAALTTDRYGIAYAKVRYATPNVKTLALGGDVQLFCANPANRAAADLSDYASRFGLAESRSGSARQSRGEGISALHTQPGRSKGSRAGGRLSSTHTGKRRRATTKAGLTVCAKPSRFSFQY
jgi:ABC-type phosphate transport system substrate-binding protein